VVKTRKKDACGVEKEALDAEQQALKILANATSYGNCSFSCRSLSARDKAAVVPCLQVQVHIAGERRAFVSNHRGSLRKRNLGKGAERHLRVRRRRNHHSLKLLNIVPEVCGIANGDGIALAARRYSIPAATSKNPIIIVLIPLPDSRMGPRIAGIALEARVGRAVTSGAAILSVVLRHFLAHLARG
jgi:hypothetical protein